MHHVQALWTLVKNLKENRTTVLFDHIVVQAMCHGVCWSGPAEEFFSAMREANKESGTMLSGDAQIGAHELRATTVYAPMPDGSVMEIPPGDDRGTGIQGDRDARFVAKRAVYDAWFAEGGRIEVGLWREKERAEWAARKLASLPCAETPPAGYAVDGITVD